MLTEIYLGYPPEHIKKWIEENYKPSNSLLTPLTFEAVEDCEIKLHLHGAKYEDADGNTGSMFGLNIQNSLLYSINNAEWLSIGDFFGDFNTFKDNDQYLTYQLNKGDTIKFKCKDGKSITRFFLNNDLNISFITGLVNVSGNIMTLLDPTGQLDVVPSNAFNALFAETNIVDASKLLLPAKTVEQSGYQAMFYGNTVLIKAPELPATTIEIKAYKSMFDGCENLETPPSVLPAETLTETCYYQMFQNCANLKTIPDIKATTLGASCCGLMFNGCSSLGDLSEFTLKAEYPPESDGNVHCYQAMFYNSGVTHTPNILLKTITVNNDGYNISGTIAFMFAKCKNLKAAYFPNIISISDITYGETFAAAANNITVHYNNGETSKVNQN